MGIKVEEDKKFLIVNLSGEIDHHNAGKIRMELDEKIKNMNKNQVILNFKNVTFVDSSGIGLVIGRYKLLKNTKGEIYITNLSKEVHRIFDISGIFRLLKYYDTVAQCKSTEG